MEARDERLREELRRIAYVQYDAEDSERNHQAFAAAHLRTQERLDEIDRNLSILRMRTA